MSKIKLAIIGSQGLPAQYGGFETLVEYICEYLANEYDVTVFCSSVIYKERITVYKNCTLEYVNVHPNGFKSVLYDGISVLRSVMRYDKILILGVSGGILMPFFLPFRKKFILNIGGLDWKRSKWNYFTQKFLKLSESIAVKCSKVLISDNTGIKEYLLNEYNRNSFEIAYGGDQVLKVQTTDESLIKYPFLAGPYAFTVARIQPDNNIDLLLSAFDGDFEMPLVFVGNWNSCIYGRNMKKKFGNRQGVVLLDAIYNQSELDLLRSNCTIYLHGHSAGGTNPALVEAMNLGLPIFAFKSTYNIYTTKNKAIYFQDAHDLKNMVTTFPKSELRQLGLKMGEIAKECYSWRMIAQKYAEIIMI